MLFKVHDILKWFERQRLKKWKKEIQRTYTYIVFHLSSSTQRKKLWRVNDLLFYSFLFLFFDELYVKSFILKLTCIIFFSYLYIFKYDVYFIFGPILIFLEVSKDFNHDFLLTFLDGYMKLKDTKKLENFGSLPTAIAKNISI